MVLKEEMAAFRRDVLRCFYERQSYEYFFSLQHLASKSCPKSRKISTTAHSWKNIQRNVCRCQIIAIPLQARRIAP